jgi:diaminopimelate decarboxylase
MTGSTGPEPGPASQGADREDGHGPAVRRLADWNADRLCDLADEYGTPTYVTDLDRVRENYRRFAAAFPDAHVMYAAKANTGRALLRALLDAGADIECAAAGELQRAIEAGADPDTLQYTAVNPPGPDLDYAVDLRREAPGLTITAGAGETLDRLEERGYDGRLAIRVNPGIGTGHHEKVATGKDAKFGVPAERVPALADDAADRFDLVGLHMHVGSGILGEDLDAHREAIGAFGDLIREVERDHDLEFADVGGGFGVPYRENEPPLDLAAAARATREALGDVEARLALEPGRYVVADASCILGRVNTRKQARGTFVVGIDAGLTTLVRPAMFDAYHPIRNCSREDGETVHAAVGGPMCTSADTFATDRPLVRPERDDVLAIGMAGAYGYELVSQFHSQPRPAEVGIEDGEARVIRERETVADVASNERD